MTCCSSSPSAPRSFVTHFASTPSVTTRPGQIASISSSFESVSPGWRTKTRSSSYGFVSSATARPSTRSSRRGSSSSARPKLKIDSAGAAASIAGPPLRPFYGRAPKRDKSFRNPSANRQDRRRRGGYGGRHQRREDDGDG